MAYARSPAILIENNYKITNKLNYIKKIKLKKRKKLIFTLKKAKIFFRGFKNLLSTEIRHLQSLDWRIAR